MSYKIALFCLSLFLFTSPSWGQLAPVVSPHDYQRGQKTPVVRLAKQPPAQQQPAPPTGRPTQPPSLPSVDSSGSPNSVNPRQPSALDSLGQPTSTNTPLNPNQRTSPFASLAGRRGGRLFRTPHMFGDFTSQNAVVDVFFGSGYADIPLAGGARRMKVGEQNRALPQDRAYFFYNHFRNAIDTQANNVSNSSSANRYTIGLEKAFDNNKWSLDIRFPLTSRFESNDAVMPITGGEVGNLQVIMKQRLSCSRTLITSAGFGFDLPTGSGVTVDAPFVNQRFSMDNDAVTIQPFLAFQAAPNDLFFGNGFVQVDVPVNGNRITVLETQADDRVSRVLDEAVLLHLDLSGGIWLYESTAPSGFTGLAAVAEFHYATGIGSTPFAVFDQYNTFSQFQATDARANVANVTLGLHAALGRASAFRVGGAFPLSRDNRVFSSEIQASLILGY